MGMWEVIKKASDIFSHFKRAKKGIEEFKADALILIDYPGFNLRMAKWACKRNIPVFYYISPQLWAWKEGRIRYFKKYIDKLFVILPFEVDWYKERGIDVLYFGHPLSTRINQYRSDNPKERENIIALIPGSRKQEISRLLPIMLEAVMGIEGYDIVISKAPTIEESVLAEIISESGFSQEYTFSNNTYDLFSKARAGLVTSGTATLEAALFEMPQVVMYKANPWTYAIGKRIVSIKYFSLPNLILDKPAIPELLQEGCTAGTTKAALDLIIEEKENSKIANTYSELRQMLEKGNAGKLTAEYIYKSLLS
jgi:lipid-A-disaccharide synthase